MVERRVDTSSVWTTAGRPHRCDKNPENEQVITEIRIHNVERGRLLRVGRTEGELWEIIQMIRLDVFIGSPCSVAPAWAHVRVSMATYFSCFISTKKKSIAATIATCAAQHQCGTRDEWNQKTTTINRYEWRMCVHFVLLLFLHFRLRRRFAWIIWIYEALRSMQWKKAFLRKIPKRIKMIDRNALRLIAINEQTERWAASENHLIRETHIQLVFISFFLFLHISICWLPIARTNACVRQMSDFGFRFEISSSVLATGLMYLCARRDANEKSNSSAFAQREFAEK